MQHQLFRLKTVAMFIMAGTCCNLAESANAQIRTVIPTSSQPGEVLGAIDITSTNPGTAGTTLEDLRNIESMVHALIPKVQACVVGIEGGSGFIVSESGLIITVSHVTKKTGRRVTVQFPDGKSYPAVTLGSNPANDTGAVQLLEKGPWPHLEISEPRLPDKGQWCLAFGYPISFPRGVPATVRLGRVTRVSEHQIVTDCPIMGGDSGGPLVDLEGKVIGISTGVTTNVEENIHVPYEAFEVDQEIILAGSDVAAPLPSSQEPYFGVLGETDGNRVRIRKVFKGSPADIAGLRPDDVITQLDGVPLDSFSKFLERLDLRRPGERVAVQLNRYGKLLDVYVILQQR